MEDLESKDYQELMALKKEYEEFVYIVSHDLKSPLRAIANISSWIEDDLEGNDNAEIIANFSLMKGRVSRLESMMNALIELSRVNRLELDQYEVSIPELVKECAAMATTTPNVSFHYRIEIEHEKVTTLAKKLEKVLFNLIENAIQFHDKDKINIFIEIIETNLAYEFAIRDDGPGIPEAVREKIFNIFYTVSAKDLVETTGAGLTICKKIVKLVGGTIELVFDAGSGTTFKFSWPKEIVL